MFPKLRENFESTTQVVCSSRRIYERKTYFHECVETVGLRAGGFGVRFSTEGRWFSLIPNRPDCLCRAHSTFYSLYMGMQNEWCYSLLRIYVVIMWMKELYGKCMLCVCIYIYIYIYIPYISNIFTYNFFLINYVILYYIYILYFTS
jgi:hypothetical protein